jgi:hypothetical protein
MEGIMLDRSSSGFMDSVVGFTVGTTFRPKNIMLVTR